jgi:cysteine-rich secretory family protein
MTRSSASTFRRLVAAGLVAFGLAGVAGAVAPSAQAVSSCAYYQRNFANRDITKMSDFARQRTGWCVVNAVRAQNGVGPLKNNTYLRTSALGHAQRSASLRWWSLNDGLVSHVDPTQAGMTPAAAIAQRIARAGYCKVGTPNTNENTFSAWGTGQFPPTINGAVAWWLQDPPHRATLLNPAYVSIGFAAVPGTAFNVATGGAQAATFVMDVGACSTL